MVMSVQGQPETRVAHLQTPEILSGETEVVRLVATTDRLIKAVHVGLTSWQFNDNFEVGWVVAVGDPSLADQTGTGAAADGNMFLQGNLNHFESAVGHAHQTRSQWFPMVDMRIEWNDQATLQLRTSEGGTGGEPVIFADVYYVDE